MKKITMILVFIIFSILLLTCGEPWEDVQHYVTLYQGEEYNFQLNPTTKWDTAYFPEILGKEAYPLFAESFELYIKDGDPPYYNFLYIADDEYTGEDEARISLKRYNNGSFDSGFAHYFYFTILAPEGPPKAIGNK